MIFSKAVLTFLAIGALWVNVSAAPVPALLEPDPGSPNRSIDVDMVRTNQATSVVIPKSALRCGLPRSFSVLSYRDLTFVFSVADPPPGYGESFLDLGPAQKSRWESFLDCFCELPRLFSVHCGKGRKELIVCSSTSTR